MRFVSTVLPVTLVASADVVSELNSRFNAGKASSDLAAAGVIMHHFSKSNAFELGEPWRPYTPEECAEGDYAHCDKSDRGCTLLINNQIRDPEDNAIPLYAPQKGGIIFNPHHATVMCAYSQDGGTDDRSDRGCGCSAGDTDCEARKTKNSCVLDEEMGDADYSRCWWGAEDLDEMMNRQSGVYNEVVLATEPWLEFLPESVEAFFYAKDAEQMDATVEIFEDFQKTNPESCVPLVVMDNYAESSPFSYSAKMTPNEGCTYISSTTKTPTTTTAKPSDPSAATSVQSGVAAAVAALIYVAFK